MKKPRIVLADYLANSGLDDLVAAGGPADFDIVKLDVRGSEDAQGDLLKDADVIFFIGGGVLPEAVLRNANRLKFIQTLSAGFEFLDRQLLGELGIPFATSGDLNSPAVAEHTIGLMIAVARKLVQSDTAVRAGKWLLQEPATHPYTYGELFQKRVGIIGLGNIGRNVAKRLRGFDCDLVYSSPRPLNPDKESELGIDRVSSDELFDTSDFVTLHVPLTPETRHLVNRNRLAQMKPSSILINTTRGAVVDEAALIDALQSGGIAGAGLDVLEIEPPDCNNPLLQMDNVVVTPHCGGGTSGTQQRIISFCWQNIKDVIEGRKPGFVVS